MELLDLIAHQMSLSLAIVAVGFGNTNGSGTRFLMANS
jgi:hypothetical protein